MTEKKSSVTATVESNTKTTGKRVPPKNQPETAKKKGCMDRWVENPGFPWMVIAVLFTLLVIMFWREHYNYWMGRMHGGNVFYKEGRMLDESYRPIMEDRMRGERE